MGQDRDRDDPPLDIYGPEGLRLWLRMAIRYSVSRIVPNYRVHEIMNIPMAPEWRYSRHTDRYFYQGNQFASGRNTESPVWKQQGLAGEDPESWITQASRIHLESSLKFGELDGGR
jgi:ribonuclease BN (tRNA processing enzyme)